LKKDIHPKYIKCTVTCACGNSFETRSTVPSLRLDICSACHPFYTGKQKLVDTAGRVEQFKRKFEKSQIMQKSAAERAAKIEVAKAAATAKAGAKGKKAAGESESAAQA